MPNQLFPNSVKNIVLGQKAWMLNFNPEWFLWLSDKNLEKGIYNEYNLNYCGVNSAAILISWAFPPPFFSQNFGGWGWPIGSSWLVCTLVCHGREGTRQPRFPFHLWTSVWVQRLLWVWSNRVSGQFFMSWPWAWAGRVTVAYEPGVFSTGSWLLSSSLMRLIHWGVVEKLWTWKQALAKKEAEGTSKRRMRQVRVLLSLTAKLRILGCGKRKEETPFVYVKHQVCRVGKWEWRAGWRIFFLCIWT